MVGTLVLVLDHLPVLLEHLGPILGDEVVEDQLPEKVLLLVLDQLLVLQVLNEFHVVEHVLNEILVVRKDRLVDLYHEQTHREAYPRLLVFRLDLAFQVLEIPPPFVPHEHEWL